MKHPINATLLNHWLSIRRGRRVPDRNDLDPMAIRGVLAFTFMLEVGDGRPADRPYAVRVSGTRLDALFGRSVKDMRFADLWQSRDDWELRSVTEAVLDDGVPAVVGGTGAPEGHAPVAVEMLMLPLRCRGRTHDRLLCSLVPLTMPSWLGLAGVAPLGLTTWRMVDTADGATAPAEPATSTAVPVFDTRRRFAVIEGGRLENVATAEPTVQGRVKIPVARSTIAPLSTRTS